MDSRSWHGQWRKNFDLQNGVFKLSQAYEGLITPGHGTAPVRMATRDFQSFFLGAIRGVYVWNRALAAAEVRMVYENVIPHTGLVAEYRLETRHCPRFRRPAGAAELSAANGQARHTE
jgi:hypothetical protein